MRSIAPILASAVLRMGGWVEGELPVWLVEAALVVTGAAIGSRFAGADVRGLAALAGWTALGVALLTLVSATFASVVSSFMDVSWIDPRSSRESGPRGARLAWAGFGGRKPRRWTGGCVGGVGLARF